MLYTRCDLVDLLVASMSIIFQSMHLYKVRCSVGALKQMGALISINAPIQGVMVYAHYRILPAIFQSTHLYKVRYVFVALLEGDIMISVNAPIQGAIANLNKEIRELEISINAPIQGTIKWCTFYTYNSANFNPRTYTRCDQVSSRPHRRCKNISIHAPIQGAITVLGVHPLPKLISIHDLYKVR